MTAMDIVGPLPRSDRGNRYILTFEDAFTRYAKAVSLPDDKAETIARVFVTEIVTRHGAPRQLLTDRGTNFLSTLMKRTCEILRIRKLQTTPYHPEGNRMIK